MLVAFKIKGKKIKENLKKFKNKKKMRALVFFSVRPLEPLAGLRDAGQLCKGPEASFRVSSFFCCPKKPGNIRVWRKHCRVLEFGMRLLVVRGS